MENFKKYKNLYIIAGVVVIVICVIVCYFLDSNTNSNSYSFINSNETSFENEINTNDVPESKNDKQEQNILYIHITGEVVNPGVVQANEGDRIKDIIEKAGGVTELADLSNVNLAYSVEDGQKINIPSVNNTDSQAIEHINVDKYTTENKSTYITKDSGNAVVDGGNLKNSKCNKVNINEAMQTELETLDGIGPSTAAKIIEYRKQNGNFKSIEEIKNISGVGEAKFSRIKDNIDI